MSSIGDPCVKESHFACAPDETQIVTCLGKKFIADDKCKRNEKCAVKGELVGCRLLLRPFDTRPFSRVCRLTTGST